MLAVAGLRFFAVVAFVGALLPRAVAAQATPSIVVILADDLGFGDVGAYNPASKIPTPNIDRLATQGVRLTDAHTPSGVCTPTRYGLLTGRYAWRSRLKNGVLRDADPPLLESERLTLAEMLRDSGYETAAIGKWHLGRTFTLLDPERGASLDNIDWSQPVLDGPNQHGFTYFFGRAEPAWAFMENDRVLARPTERFDLSHLPTYLIGGNNNRGIRSPGFRYEKMVPRYVEETVGFIDRTSRSGKPLFVYFAPVTPHRPVSPNESFQGRSAAGLYGDFVHELDWAVGEIVAALERNSMGDETLVILTSDNGPELDAYRRVLEFQHASMGEWRGVKRDLWEGGHRVPFIARWPGRIPAGSTSDEVICLTDLFRTVAGIVDYELPDGSGEDSYDVLPALLAKDSPNRIREATVHHSAKGNFAIRRGDWVLIDHPSGEDSREPEWFRRERMVRPHEQEAELFNLGEDPQQTRNLAAARPELARELKALLEKYKRDGRSRRAD